MFVSGMEDVANFMKKRVVFILIFAFIFSFCGGLTIVNSSVSFAEEENQEIGESVDITLEDVQGVIEQEYELIASEVMENDENYIAIKNLLSNPDQIKIYEIKLKDSQDQYIESLDGFVMLKIKVSEIFDVEKINIYRVTLSGEKIKYDFMYSDGYIQIQTDNFDQSSFYTISQVAGFKPVSPTKEGTSVMALVLFLVGGVVLVAALISVILLLVKKKNS